MPRKQLSTRMQDPCFLALWSCVDREYLCVRARVQHAGNVRLVTHVCRCDRHERWSRWLRHGRFRLVVRSSLSVRIICPALSFLLNPTPLAFPFHLLHGPLTLSRLCSHEVIYRVVQAANRATSFYLECDYFSFIETSFPITMIIIIGDLLQRFAND